MFILLLTFQVYALPGWKLDGLEVGQAAADLPWPHPPRNDGQFKHGPTRVEVQGGKVVTLWGARLLTSGSDGDQRQGQRPSPLPQPLTGAGEFNQACNHS